MWLPGARGEEIVVLSSQEYKVSVILDKYILVICCITKCLWLMIQYYSVFLVAQTVKGLPTMQETQVQSLGWEDHLEKEMTTHSSILA